MLEFGLLLGFGEGSEISWLECTGWSEHSLKSENGLVRDSSKTPEEGRTLVLLPKARASF